MNGCKHYVRQCYVWCNLCSDYFWCRLCHDEMIQQKLQSVTKKEELIKLDHKFDRYNLEKVSCSNCGEQQQPSNKCTLCEIRFADYYCNICHLWKGCEPPAYHCNDCGMCRIGRKDDYFHCTKCNMCIANNAKNDHKCFQNSFMTNCPICFEFLHTSTTNVFMGKCGHVYHTNCINQLLQNGDYKCPHCKKSLADMSGVWQQLGNLYANVEKSETKMIQFYCNDCETKQNSFANGFNLYMCNDCNGFNTNLI